MHDVERIVREFLECWHRLDLEAALAHMADDAVFTPDLKGVPTAGREAIRRLWSGYMGAFTTYDCEIRSLLGRDRLVFVERTERLRLKRGTEMTLRIVGVFEFDGAGRIAAWRDYWDTSLAPV